jgi:hypothetical protein
MNADDESAVIAEPPMVITAGEVGLGPAGTIAWVAVPPTTKESPFEASE